MRRALAVARKNYISRHVALRIGIHCSAGVDAQCDSMSDVVAESRMIMNDVNRRGYIERAPARDRYNMSYRLSYKSMYGTVESNRAYRYRRGPSARRAR